MVLTFDTGKNKMVKAGKVDGKDFIKRVKNKHYMVKEKGYGIQQSTLLQLLDTGVENIIIKTKTGTLKSPIQAWVTYGKARNYGHGEQVFLSTVKMQWVG